MLHLAVNSSDGTPIYLQIVRQIKHLVATNRLEPGDELPAVRVLAQQLVINPNTVVRAYKELEAAGLIFTMRGSGDLYLRQAHPLLDTGAAPYSRRDRRRSHCGIAQSWLLLPGVAGNYWQNATRIWGRTHTQSNQGRITMHATVDAGNTIVQVKGPLPSLRPQGGFAGRFVRDRSGPGFRFGGRKWGGQRRR